MRALRAFIVTAMAACGLLAAHWLDYVLVVPDAQHRHDLLFRTGHGYLPSVVGVVIAAGLVAAIASTALGLTGSARRKRSLRADVLLLALAQTGAFVALESVERILSRLANDGRFFIVIAVGTALQLLTASAATFIVRLLQRAGEALRDLLVKDRPEQVVVRSVVEPIADVPREQVLVLARAPRAPPVFLAA